MEKYIAGGGEMGHSLNRFNTAPTITGTYVVPNHPNTKKVSIVAAGVNELGQRVAMIVGEQVVETPSSLGPDFPPTVAKTPFEMEIPIGEDMDGVSSDVYQEIYQNHPEMARQIEADRNARFGTRVDNMPAEEPEEQQEVNIPDAQKEQVKRYDALKKRRDEILNDPNPVGREGNLEVERIQEEMDVLLSDKALGPILRERDEAERRRINEGIASANRTQQTQAQQSVIDSDQDAPEDPLDRVENMAKESSSVIAKIPDAMKERVTSIIDAALPEKLYAYETQNSVGEKAIGFKNEAGEDTGEMIFFS
jgi:hypothetical protein